MTESYHVLALAGISIFAYSCSWLLAKTGYFNLAVHRRIWNMALSAAFLVSCLDGLLLAIMIDLKYIPAWYRTFLWVHVEAGIVMTVIAFFHMIWHKPYYLAVFRLLFRRNK